VRPIAAAFDAHPFSQAARAEKRERTMPQPQPTPKQAPKPKETGKKDTPVTFKDWASI